MELFDVVCLVMTMSSNRRAAKYVISTKAQSQFNWNCQLSILFSLFPSHHNGLMWQWKTSLPTETSELMEQSVLDKPIINQQVKFPIFHEPKCSLLCLQNPITGPCPEPDESSTTIPPHFFKIHFLQNVRYFKTRETSAHPDNYAKWYIEAECFSARSVPKKHQEQAGQLELVCIKMDRLI